MRIQDKVIVITGGASGLGLATALYHGRGERRPGRHFRFECRSGRTGRGRYSAPSGPCSCKTDVSNEESVQMRSTR